MPTAPDRIALAIAAASARPAPQVWKGRVALKTTGREIGLVIPTDLSPVELVDLVAFLSGELPRVLAEARSKASPILVPQ